MYIVVRYLVKKRVDGGTDVEMKLNYALHLKNTR